MKSKLLSLFCVLSVFASFSQTYVPDDNFEQELINLGYDSGPLDDYVPTANIVNVQVLSVQSKNISDLTGIQDFVSLLHLNCYINQITSLDLSNNTLLVSLSSASNMLTSVNLNGLTNLKYLSLTNNNLASIDVSTNPNIETFGIANNPLNSLDVSNNVKLASLACSDTLITTLLLDNNPDLTSLQCSNTQLVTLNLMPTSIDVLNAINNPNLIYIDARHINQNSIASALNGYVSMYNIFNNPSLSCILVNDLTFPFLQTWPRDATARFYDTEANCDRAIGNATNNNLLDVSVINPTRDYTIINNLVMPSNIYLYDMEGNLILERENYFGEDINTSYIEPGIYFFRIVNEEQNESIKVVL